MTEETASDVIATLMRPVIEGELLNAHSLSGANYRRNQPAPVSSGVPSAETIIHAIALAGGKLQGHARYLTKYDMIRMCQEWMRQKQAVHGVTK